MLKGQIDRPKLEASLRKFAKQFGDTNAQAVARWGVSTCRELAKQTQVWGDKATTETDAKTGEKSKRGPLQKQQGAIIKDALNVIRVTNDSYNPKAKKGNRLTSVEAVNDWIEVNRTRRRARTAKLSTFDKKDCPESIFNQAIKVRSKRAGTAKGGWLGAGMDIAKSQTGTDRINIGKNYLGYAQKHAKFGKAKMDHGLVKPFAELTNTSRHSSSDYVLKRSTFGTASTWGLKKTISWYKKTLKTQDSKK